MATHDKDDDLAPEELEVLQILHSGQQRIEQLDNLISNPPALSGPAPRPKGAIHDEWTPAKREQYKKMLEYQKTLVKADVKEKAVKAIEKSPLNIQLRAYDKVDRWVEQAPDDKENVRQRNLTVKDMSDSQDVSMRILSNQKQKSGTVKEVQDIKSPPPEPSTPKTMSMSMRFSQSLNYTEMKEQPGKSDKSLDREIDRD